MDGWLCSGGVLRGVWKNRRVLEKIWDFEDFYGFMMFDKGKSDFHKNF
jgi:hypothetical protein